jgi:hypothetical protein
MMTEVEARVRRTEIVRLLGGDEGYIHQRAASWNLDAHEMVLYDELKALNYLLDGDARP